MNLYAHQRKIIVENRKKVGLFLGTGSGKTRTALFLAREKTLVICPKTQKEDGNWERENEVLENAVELTVVSKETFRRDHAKLSKFDTIIVDEAHTCLGVTPNTRQRNKQIIPRASQLFEALDDFIKRTNPERIYLCTATIVRNPMTVFAAAQILGYKWNFYQFRDTFYQKLPMPGREVYIAKSNSDTKDHLARIVRSIGHTGQLSDYFDVPKQTYKDVYVELTAQQKARLKDIALEYPEPIVQIGKRNQIENGILSGDEYSKAELFTNEKMLVLEDYMIEFPRMIVFAKYTLQINEIAKLATTLKKKVFLLTGETKDRGELLEEAKKCDEYVFIVSAQISAGWELADCPVMVFASRTYSFVDYEQAKGRILRANSLKKNLYINLIVRDGVDEAVHDCLTNKKDFNDRIYGI